MMECPKTTLWEAYSNRSYYYPRLKQEMMAILQKSGNGTYRKEILEHFCQKQGERPLSSAEDFGLIIKLFEAFLQGIEWQLLQKTTN